jgi:hypothetical protein
MPNQSLLYTGRVLASSQLNPMMHVCRELCGGQICVTPDFAAFQDSETAGWLDKYYSISSMRASKKPVSRVSWKSVSSQKPPRSPIHERCTPSRRQ